MKTLLTLTAGLLIAVASKGQSAVALCQSTGAYGYCYGDYNPGQCARARCLEYGGQVPNVIFSTVQRGHGAVAMAQDGDGRRIVGAAGGYESANEARQEALRQCRIRGGSYPSIVDTWYDGD